VMLVMSTVCCGDVVPTVTGPKSRAVLVIRKRPDGVVPVPLRVMLNGWPFQVPLEVAVAGPAAVGEKV
jgi:hypothetical protein